MQAAIDCTKAKLQGQEVELATMHSPEDNDITKNQISEARELIADMEQRVSPLSHERVLWHTTNSNLPPS
jgi:HAT1-interacting factor 1